MRKRFQKFLLLLPMLMAIMGLPQTAKALEQADMPGCFSVTPGATIADMSELNSVTFSFPSDSEYFFSKSNSVALNAVYLQTVDSEGNGTNTTLKFKTGVISDDKKSITYALNGDITSLTATPGAIYRINFNKASTFQVFGGDLSVALGNPGNMHVDFTYAPGGAAASVVVTSEPARAEVISVDDFGLLTVNFEGATNFALNKNADMDMIHVTVNGSTFNAGFGRNDNQITLRNAEGLVVVDIDPGLWDLTLADGSVISSPAFSTYFYIGEIVPTVTPAENAEVEFASFKKYSVAFPDGWTAALGDKSIRNDVSYIEIGGEKLFIGRSVFTADTAILTWEPTLDDINITEDTKATVFMPQGMYNLTYDGKVFQSPELTWDFTLVVPQQEEPVTVTATTTPEAGAMVYGKLSEFSVAFACAEQSITGMTLNENAAARAMVTFAYAEDEGYSLGYGLTDAGNGVFTLDTPFAPKENTEVTISLREGAFTLTLADGRTVESPAVDATFTVGPEAVEEPAEINYTTVPAQDAQVDELESFQVNFTDASAVDLDWSKLSNDIVTLKYDDTALYYGAGLADDSDDPTKMVLDFPLKPNAPTLVTVNIAEGAYLVTIDGKEVASPAIEFSFTVGKEAPEPVEVKYTTTPAQDAVVDAIEGFSVNFEGVKEVAWANGDAMPDITVKCGDTTLSYFNGFVEGNEVYEFELDEVLSPDTPTLCTVKIGAGVYKLTLEDGSEQLSEAIEFSFTVGCEKAVEVAYTTTPAQDSKMDELERFSVNFEGVKDIAWGDNFTPEDIKLVCGDTTLSFTDGLYEDDEINVFILEEVLAPTTPTLCTVTIAAGVYTLTLEDGTEVPSPAVEFSFTVGKEAPLGDDAWIPLTSLEQLDGAEVAFVWYYMGKKAGLASAPAKAPADRVTNGIENASVMSTIDDPTISGGKLYNNDYIAEAIEAGNFTRGESVKITGIRTMPENAMIAKAAKTDEGYSFQFMNYTPSAALAEACGLVDGEPIYMSPLEDLDLNRNCVQPSNTPRYNSVSISANGHASITSKYRNSKDIFSACYTTYNGQLVNSFMYIDQVLDQGSLYLFVKKSSLADKVVVVADPANESTIEGTTGKETIQLSFATFETATANADAELTATLNGEPVDVDWDKQYPANVTVTLPENAEGTFELNIPAGWYSVDVYGVETKTPAYTYTLNFKAALEVAKDLDVVISPENGSTVAKVSDIEILFPENVKSVELNESVAYSETGISATLGGQTYQTPMMRNETNFTYRPEVVAQSATEFTFTMAEGFYIVTFADGSQALSPEISTTVTIDPSAGAVDVAYTTTPAEGSNVAELTEVSVLFEDVEEVAWGATASPDGFTISYGNVVMKYGYDFEEGPGINDPITTMVLNEAFCPEEDTVVTVNIAAGFYQLTLTDGTETPSPAIEFSFTVDSRYSGVEFNLAEGASNDVYTTTGICVLRNATAADMKTLAPGLYIVNGRVILKK